MFCFRQIYLIFLFFSIFALSVIQPSSSKATNFFKWLLQHNKQEQTQPQPQPRVIKQKIYKPQKKMVPQKPTQKLKEKNAKRILILGDFVASAVSDALKKAFIDHNDITIIDNTVPNSGLARIDYYSWGNHIFELIDKNKPDVIIMVIGANDNQPIKTPHGIFNAIEPEWMNIYKQRITEITENLHASGKPWIWMGQPAFGDDNLTQKVKSFNRLYKDITEVEGGYFIDIWDGFIDKQGQFSFADYDINGKVIQLRTHNGINFTYEGKRKLASYLEKTLKDILNFYISPHESPLLTHVKTLQFNQETQKIERQPPMSLNDIVQQNTYLLKKVEKGFIKKSWLPLNGHQKDRADNFSLP